MDTTFPPSPQWHKAHSASLSYLSKDAGHLLYSLNSSIHIINPFSLKHQGILKGGHSGRINSISSRPLPQSDVVSGNTGNAGQQEIVDPTAAQGSITGVDTAMTDKPWKALVASGGDDLKIVCWDVSSRGIVATLAKVHQKEIMAVEWTSNGQLIVSGDKGGVISIWDPKTGKTHKKVLQDKPSVSCISACPTEEGVIAIGLETGDIHICQVSLKGFNVLYRLHGHSNKIQSLAWQPCASGNNRQENSLLASGSADQNIRIWDVSKEISVSTLKIPDQDEKAPPQHRAKIWVPVGWALNGQEVISSTGRGAVVRWTLRPGQQPHYTKLNRGHAHIRQVFQILVWRSGTFAFTISMDRRLIAWDLEGGQGVAQVECIGGNVSCMDISTLDPGKVVMGLGNETIKIWNTLSQDQPYESWSIERLLSRVKALKCHPVEEGKLCFGLENGKVGVIENIGVAAGGVGQKQPGKQQQAGKGKKSKPGQLSQTPVFFQSYHEKPVISMSWCSPKVFEAPVPELFDLALRDSTFCVVSCGTEGKILISDASRPRNPSLDLEVVLQRQNPDWYRSHKAFKGLDAPVRRDFAIHPNEDLMAIGNGDGAVEVFELKYFKLVYVYQGHRLRVNRLKWCWSGTGSSGDQEADGAYLLASGSDDGALAIHSLGQFSASSMAEKWQRERLAVSEDTPGMESGGASPTEAGVIPTSQALAYFKCHSKGISDICWSPHGHADGDAGGQYMKLVTASFEGKAVVYQVRTDTKPLDELEGDATGQEECRAIDREANACGGAGIYPDKAAPVQRIPLRHSRPVARFSDHEGQVHSVQWSFAEVDRIYSGGNDWRCCAWDWKDHLLTESQVEDVMRRRALSAGVSQGQARSQDSVPPMEPAAAGIDDNTVPEADGSVSTPGTSKRTNDSTLATANPQLTKKTKTSHPTSPSITSASSARPQQQQSAGRTQTPKIPNPSKLFNLFPKSTAAFKVQSRQAVHLEIIRLVRNLYCRRPYHKDIKSVEAGLKTLQLRWRDMRIFFEQDQESEGVAISRALGADVDELNLMIEDEDDAANEHSDAALNAGTPQTEDEAGDDDSVPKAEESLASRGDLVFYGSREEVKALAEMEARELSVASDGSRQEVNVFTIGSGFGVPPSPAFGRSTSSSASRIAAAGQPCQIPIAYWMGDVPQMIDILGSLPSTALGVQDWMGIALAPLGGVNAWKMAMAQSAEKFKTHGEVHAASLCFLGIGRVPEAVDVYREKGLYREALMLLRIRLWEDDEHEDDGADGELEDEEDLGSTAETGTLHPGIPSDHLLSSKAESNPNLHDLQFRILAEWGQHLDRKGFFEQAAKCQLTLAALLSKRMRRKQNLGKDQVLPTTLDEYQGLSPSTALQTIARRGDPASLRTVAGLAILLNDPSRHQRIQSYKTAMQLKREADLHRRLQKESQPSMSV